MADKNVNININAKNNASGQFTQVANEFGKVEGQLNRMSGLPGPIGSAISQLSSAFGSLGSSASSAGAVSASAWGPVGLVIGVVVAEVGVAVAAFNALSKAANDSVHAASSWADQVDSIAESTGMTAQQASTWAAAGKIVGMSADEMASKFDVLARKQDEAGGSAGKSARAMNDAWEKAGQAAQRAEEDLARSRTDTNEQFQRQLDDLARQRTDTAEQVKQRLDDLEEQHAQRVLDLNASIEDAQSSYEDRRQSREEQLNDSLDKLNEKAADSREAIMARYANANTDLGKAARDAELAELDKKTSKERDKLTDKYNKEEAKDKAAQDKKLAKIEQQITRENAAYAKQSAQIEEENRKRIEQYNLAQQRMEEDHQKRLDAEELSYKRSMENVAQSMKAASAKADEAVTPVDEAFKKLNIDVAEFDKLSPQDKIRTLFDALLKLPEGFDRGSVAQKLFGRGAREMNDLMKVYQAEGWDGLVKKAREYGLELDDNQVEAGKKFQRSLNETNLMLEGVKIKIGEALMPVFQKFLDKVLEFWDKHGPQMINILTRLIDVYLPWLMRLLSGAFTVIDTWTTGVEKMFQGIENGFNHFLGLVREAIAPGGSLNQLATLYILMADALGIKVSPEARMLVSGITTKYTSSDGTLGVAGAGASNKVFNNNFTQNYYGSAPSPLDSAAMMFALAGGAH